MRVAVALLMGLVGLCGCTRQHYRRWADAETYPIVVERTLADPQATIGRIQVEPDPQSRLSDPFDPDRPPQPLDDPAAAIFMANPGGLKGSKHWGKDGVTSQIDPPYWLDSLELNAEGKLPLSQDRAVDLALLNSREYQTALENVYLQALSLTLNRFEFDVRWFGRGSLFYSRFGTSAFPTETNTLTTTNNLGFERNFAAGGQLLVDFANAMVIEFTGKSYDVRSNLVLSFIQPLLRNAGRKVRLEALTQAERDTLYTVRDFARFRKQFWANVAVQSGGYLDLLLAVQTLRNAEANLQRQEETYRLYSELFRGGRASVVEVDQFYQSLQAARLTVIDSEFALQRSLDQFKLRLGLPPRLPVELDESLLRQFQLADPALERLRENLETFQRARLAELDNLPPFEQIQGAFKELQSLVVLTPQGLVTTKDDLKRWEAQLAKPLDPGDDPEYRDRARSTLESLRKQIPEIETELQQLQANLDRHERELTPEQRKAGWDALNGDVKFAISVIDAILAIQTQARIYLIELPDVETEEAPALEYALNNRLDLHNQRGAVTDAWRKTVVAANALRGEVNVIATANLANDPDRNNPFDYSAEASRFNIGLEIDGPLNRLAERNVYRATLISYQRAKRAYMQLQDGIEFQIREDIRQLKRLRLSFEISRQQLLAAARQFENARLILLGPQEQRGENDTTTLNLLQALTNLLAARNALAASYINFEQQRIQLLLDLEQLQLDDRGYPINAYNPTGTNRDRPADPGAGGEPLGVPRPVDGRD